MDQSDWAMNQPVWVLSQVPGFFHYWREMSGGRRQRLAIVGFRHTGTAHYALVPGEWLTDRTDGDLG